MRSDGARTLTVDRLTKQYEGPGEASVVLSGASLTAAPGETVAILGPSGSGKSTLLNIIGSLDRPTSGTVRLGEIDVTSLAGPSLAAFRATEVGFIFQDHHLLPQLSALENVLLPTIAAGTGEGTQEHGRELLERMGVGDRADAFPGRLSGGERQRVAAARALINQPALLLCDEPTGNLDRESGDRLVELLQGLAADGVVVLMVTHNVRQAALLDRGLLLSDGKLEPWEGVRELQ